MNPAFQSARTESPAGGLVRYARRLYEILGNRRRSPRLPITGTILATCKAYLVETRYTCACVNISPGGIAIDSPEQMTVGAFVSLNSHGYGPRRLARVRHCVERPDAYRVGLQFVDTQ